MGPEFERLKEYKNELIANWQNRVVMSFYCLIKIRDHMELCDHIINTRFEIFVLLETFYYFERCRLFWYKHKRPYTETGDIPELIIKTKKLTEQEARTPQVKILAGLKYSPAKSQKPWEKDITADDKRFLKSLRIASDVSETNNDDDSNFDPA